MIPRRRVRFYKGIVKDILSSIIYGRVSKGYYLELFEKKFARYIGTEYALSICSGRVGLSVLLDAFNLEQGSEIILPAYTLKDLIYLIEKKGFKPKLVDIERDSFNIDPNLIEKAITPQTKVIVATHIFGLPCNIKKIVSIANRYGLKVIEDCAHALGAELQDKKVGSFGNAAFFSFETTKLLNTFGGGMITTDNPELAKIIKNKIKDFPHPSLKALVKILMTFIECLFIESPLNSFSLSLFKYKKFTKFISRLYLFVHSQTRVEYSQFTNLQALIGLKQLSELDLKNAQRNTIAFKFDSSLREPILPQGSKLDVKRVYYFYVVNISGTLDIEALRRKGLNMGVDVGIKAEIADNCALVHMAQKDYPVTSKVYERNLQLPMYDDLDSEDVDFIVETIKKHIS